MYSGIVFLLTMPNYSPKIENLTRQKPSWKHLPTNAVRIPTQFETQVLEYARSLDNDLNPVSFEAIISALNSLSKDEIEQLKLAVNSISGTLSEEIQESDRTVLSDDEIAAYTAKFGFVPSLYQLAIINWILRGKGHGCCNAVAGAGKSSTIEIVAKTLVESGLKHSEIKICVFGKDNSEDLIKKLGFSWKGTISTLHSAGFSLVKKELGIRNSYDINVLDQKYKRIAEDLELIYKRGNTVFRLRQERIIGNDDDFLKLIELVRLINVSPSVENVLFIAQHHEIEDVWKPDLLARWIGYCLKIGEEKAIKKECLDFVDQIWLPVKWQLNKAAWFKPYKFVLLDECLPGDSLVTLADGSQMSIQTIVEGRLPVSVLSYNEQKQIIEAKPVTGWRKVLRRGRQILQIGNLRATEDHPVFTCEQGYIPMAKAVMSQVHIMVLDHEKLRFEYKANEQGAINYYRVATWRCFHRSEQLEREAGQCQSKVYSWRSTTTLLEVEGERITALDWNTCNEQTNFNRVWRLNLSAVHTDPSSIYGDLAFNQARGKGETHYSRTFTTSGRFSDRSLVYGRWEYEASGCSNCSLLFSTRRPRTSLQLIYSQGNHQQSYANFQGTNYFDQCEGNSYFKGGYQAFHSPLLIIQIGNNNHQKLCSLSESFPSIQRNTNAADLRLKMRGTFEGSDDESDCFTFQTCCNLPNLWSGTQSQKSGSSNKENLWEKVLCSESTNYVTEKWVYCLDIEDNHNFFANSTLVHNCQDLNAVQLELVMILAGSTGRILAVGDPRQAIMGFAGADDESYNNIVKRTKAIEMPLSICYRCPRSHIELVKEIYPQIPIEPSPKAINGTITQIDSDDIEKLIKSGDMVLCRKTAPLVRLCIRLISRGIKATVKGRQVGKSLEKELEEIAKLPGYNFKFFNDTLAQYYEIKLQKYQGLDNEEQLVEILKDKLQAIATIYQSQPQATGIEDLKHYIDQLFSDKNSPITLSTCHRAKGLQAERIFIYQPEDMPMKWKNQQDWQLEQEENLLYVALTRSKSELFIVGTPEWYATPEPDPDLEEVEF